MRPFMHARLAKRINESERAVGSQTQKRKREFESLHLRHPVLILKDSPPGSPEIRVLTGHPDPADLVASFEDDERFAACSPKFQRRDQTRETHASCAGNRLRARHLNSIFVPGEQKIVELVPQLVFVVRNQ